MSSMPSNDVLNDDLKKAIEAVVDAIPTQTRVSWTDFISQVEKYVNIDLGSDLMSPTIRAIKRYARTCRK